MRTGRISGLVGGLLLAIVAGTVAAQAQEARITVAGEGRITAQPDMARVTLGVEATGDTAAQALTRASAQMTGVMEALNAADIAATDMQTGTLSVQPRYDQRRDGDGPPEIAGYVAVSDLSVRLRDMAKLGALIDDIADAGGNRLSGVSFDMQDRAPLLVQARQAAVADAMAKAALYAGAADVTLGQVIEIREPGQGQPGPMAMMESAGLRSMPVAPGEIEIAAQIVMVFAIQR